MRGFILASLLLFTSAVSAETITLGAVYCGLTKQCINIPNDASPALAINLYGARGYPWFYVYVTDAAGVTTDYYASQSSNDLTNVTLESFYFTNPLDPTAKVFTGQYIVLNGGWSTYVTCTRSGRGQHCSTHYNFTGGTIVR